MLTPAAPMPIPPKSVPTSARIMNPIDWAAFRRSSSYRRSAYAASFLDTCSFSSGFPSSASSTICPSRSTSLRDSTFLSSHATGFSFALAAFGFVRHPPGPNRSQHFRSLLKTSTSAKVRAEPLAIISSR
jgi:hypothetical protein